MQNSDGGISHFLVSSQSLIKKNCQNSRINDDIAIKLGAVTKLYKRNKATSKNSRWSHVGKLWRLLFIWSILNAGFRTHTIFLIATFYVTKTEDRTKNVTKTEGTTTLLLWVKVLFLPKNADISKIKSALIPKGIFVYFLTLQMCVYLLTKFNVSNIILNPDEPLKSAPRLGLRCILLFSASISKSP